MNPSEAAAAYVAGAVVTAVAVGFCRERWPRVELSIDGVLYGGVDSIEWEDIA